MTNELSALRKSIEDWIVDERNHVFKYTSPFISPYSLEAKAVLLEYDLATDKARYHNYNVASYEYIEVKMLPVLTLNEFVVAKLKFHYNQSRRVYAQSRIIDNFCTYDEDGERESELSHLDFSGETDHEVFKAWLLFEHLFELISQLIIRIEAKHYIGIHSHLKLIDDNFSFLRDGKKSYFQLKMDEDELNSWLINEINSFKHQVEHKGLWRSLSEKPEKHFQRVFEAVLSRVSELYNVDMSPETSAGSGIMDFKFSQGNESKICVELKLPQNPSVLNGLIHQLEKYKECEKTDKGIYVVLDSGAPSTSFLTLKEYVQELSNSGLSTEHIIFIDATEKPSASKLK
ncbi:TPA: hypothetical protein I7256_21125 [Vibrio vulnificus]|nr:hypothetical protein [Vibrio vulnificus]HAS6415018.1 hypothetical protein [Vibrio vulnificus]